MFIAPAGGHIHTCCSDIAKHPTGCLLIISVVLTNSCHVCTLILLEPCVSFVTLLF